MFSSAGTAAPLGVGAAHTPNDRVSASALTENLARNQMQYVPSQTYMAPPGTSQTLTFTTTASVTRGVYWSDLLVDFGGGTFSEDRYTWPTATISIVDSYTVTATDDAGNNQVLSLQVWISDDSGLVSIWNLQ